MNSLPHCNWFGSGAVFHHVGVAVNDFPAGERLALEVFEDPIQRVAVAFLEVGGCCIELVSPRAADSPVSAALAKRQKLLHLCFEVENLEAALQHSQGEGFRCITNPVPAVAFGGRRIAWVYSQMYGLVELLEKRRPQV